ncbi:MAG: cadherin-like beta sandwich domain-containing protein [Clostridia bacterium]|nr:cadherin-like beta sandwich domain-containing protein [Clostridia bacterium]
MKKSICVIIAVLMLLPILSVTAFADSASITVSALNVTLGNTVTVNVNYSSSLSLYSSTGSLTFNSSVLKYVSGGSSVSGSTVYLYKDHNGERKTSYTVTFKAIDEGTSSLSAYVEGSDGSKKGKASASRVITVSRPAPSSNANLSYLSIKGASISPSFSPYVTTYSASVANDIDTISISASVANGKATLMGIGDKHLDEGNNSFTITVTAASGAKKSYTLNVRRRLVGEFTEAEKLTVSVNGETKHIVKNISKMTEISGFTKTETTYKDINVGVLSDVGNKYFIYYLTDADGKNPELYVKNDNDEFSKLPYIKKGKKIYIVENADDISEIKEGYCQKTFPFENNEFSAFGFNDPSMNDFYILSLFDGEKSEYFTYDSINKTLQRFPLISSFADPETETEETEIVSTDILGRVKNFVISMSMLEKILSVWAVLSIIGIIVLTILAAKKPRKSFDFDFDDDTADFDDYLR